MTADDVRERVARALCRSVNPDVPGAWDAYRDQWMQDAAAALAALADPEVVAEVAEVLLTHRHDVISYDAWCLDGCDCGWTPTGPDGDSGWDLFRDHVAAAVVERITGRAGL